MHPLHEPNQLSRACASDFSPREGAQGVVETKMDAAGPADVSRTDEDGSQADIPSSPDEAEAKRRKLRKGTHSCWECKRRKVKCQYASETHTACVGCRRRGTTCISQEFPETAIIEDEDLGPEPSAAVSRRFGQMGDRIVRVEALIEQLAKQVGNQRSAADAPERRQSQGILTPGSSNSEMSRQVALSALSPVCTHDFSKHPSSCREAIL